MVRPLGQCRLAPVPVQDELGTPGTPGHMKPGEIDKFYKEL